MNSTFFPARPDVHPKVYAYRSIHSEYEGFLKVGYTERAVEVRVAEQFPIVQPGKINPYEIVFAESAMRSDGTSFTDGDLHRRLERNGFENVGGEWFRCTAGDVRNAWLQVRDRVDYGANRTEDFAMRPEQRAAVDKTEAYFRDCERPGSRNAPKFLWNAKMRFGKTFASYQLAKRMDMKRVLVFTFKPAVEAAWQEDLETHVDFEGWQFVSRGGRTYDECDPDKPIVCFGSFQDFLGVDKKTDGIKPRNEWVHLENWDMVVFDEYHFGAWKDSAKSLFAESDGDAVDDADDANAASAGNSLDETWLPIQSRFYLYLSGTPFRALNSGEFIEEQVFNWTYSDEQRCKAEWTGERNPYEALPRVVMMTYRIPDSIRRIAQQGEFDEFDLNVFFSAEGEGAQAHFKYEEYVQKWLDLIRGSFKETAVDDLKMGAKKPPMPFSHKELLPVLTHTLWFLPNVASCEAMANLLTKRQNVFYHDYTVIVAAGSKAGMGVEAVEPVRKAMGDPLTTKTITLSCGKLTTGVTIKPWGGVLMLRNLKSPETYFQTAFRAQSPWTAKNEDGTTEILKRDCYVFDFSLNRALAMISDYSCRLSVDDAGPSARWPNS
ncbi:MAG: GIY-YIG nuclease family protein [Slackia sp.]|nr:GIY-YIG nuclease family protein [Slackia sp.]